MVLTANGWPRVIAKNGLFCLDGWPCDEFYNETERTHFYYYPEPPMRDGYSSQSFGRLRVEMSDGRKRFLDIGNPPVDFTGYDEYLPPNVFTFTEAHEFVNTSTDNNPPYLVHRGQEMLLVNGYNGDECESVPPFAEEYDAPIIGILPSGGEYYWIHILCLWRMQH